jgi:hypothetical protein
MSNLPLSLSRRHLLRVGAFGVAGLSLSRLLRLQEAHAAEMHPAADACILVFLWGAPSQFETFDPKPEAPDGIRGEFGVRRTRLPDVVALQRCSGTETGMPPGTPRIAPPSAAPAYPPRIAQDRFRDERPPRHRHTPLGSHRGGVRVPSQDVPWK